MIVLHCLPQEIVRGRLGVLPHVHRRDSSAQITTIDSSDTATSEDVDRYNLAAAVSAAAASVTKRRRSSLAQVEQKITSLLVLT